jgi:signal peptidase I
MRTAIQFAVALALVAIVSRAFFVMGLIAPIVVQGSSMAPALMGPHIAATCPRCGSVLHVGTDQLPAGGWIACSKCAALVTTGDLPISAGDTMWVDRTAFVIRGPRRWELVVFQCQNDATQLCVKRVVGLPGERVAFRDGEVLINDQRVAKPFEVDYYIRPGDGLGQAEYDPRQQRWQLGEGYFVVGDNQEVSLDSRNWQSGANLPSKLLVGRPIGRFRSGSEPEGQSVP